MEEYRDILGYNGLYKVSNIGNILSFHKRKEGEVHKTYIAKDGYCITQLSMSRIKKTHIVSRLVASAFLSEFSEGLMVDHTDRNKLNNRVDNLRMVDPSQNNFNQEKQSNNSNGYKGVYKSGKLYVAEIGCRGERYKLGRYKTAEEAAKAYDLKAVELHGEHCCTNKPLGLYGITHDQ